METVCVNNTCCELCQKEEGNGKVTGGVDMRLREIFLELVFMKQNFKLIRMIH